MASLGLVKQEAVPENDALSILLVDDTPENLQVLVDVLRPLGHKLLIAKNGASALALAKRSAPALVLLDIMMPEMDGYEVCRRLKDDPETRHIAVVFCSALDDTSSKVQGLELGAVDFISKPFNPEEVVARVTTHLAVQQLAASLRAQNEALMRELAIARDTQGEAQRKLAWTLLGPSPAATALREGIERYRNGEEPIVVLAGPPHCGAEAAARALHPPGKPFITVDCPSLSSADEYGIFEDQPDAPARLTLARGGSLFLDNIQTLSMAALQRLEKEAKDVRLLAHIGAPSARPLDWLGPHRLDLPALKERSKDIGALAAELLERHSRRTRQSLRKLNPASLRLLEGHDWPGNLEEFEDVLSRSLLTSSGDEVHVDPALLAGGTALGSYRLLSKLGEGGMGEVWSAHHYLLSRPAAVKLIRPEEAANASSGERFRREAAAIARLTSPHTITLYDFGVSEKGEFYYVMELLEGIDLDVMLARSGPLAPERMAHYLVGACRSLAEAHAAGLVHRDLKPSNLFACKLGLETDFLKVLDFGLARRTGQEVESRLTQEHTVHGTPDYIAPESLTPEVAPDGRTDMYSLGATAWHLLVGEPVFPGTSMQKIIKHSSATPPDLAQRANVPEPLAGLIMACLSKSPLERPQAHEMLERLLASGLPQRA